MISSLISLKPSSLSHKHNPRRNKKPINFLLSAVDCLFGILNFIELEDIFKLFVVYRKCRQGKEVTAKIVLYLTIGQRKYSTSEARNFLKVVTKGYTRFSLRDYSVQNNTWKQPISLDIERTHINPLALTGFSDLDFTKKPPSARSVRQPPIQIPVQPQTKIQLVQPTRHNFLSIKFNFLIFSCDDSLSSQRKGDKRRQSIIEKRPKDHNSILKTYLRTVLNAISNRNRQLGYVQGLNCWVKHMYETKLTEQEAFIYSCFLLQKLGAQKLFTNDLIKVKQMCYVFDVYLYNNLPTIYYLLKLYDVSSTTYASNWFITLFSQQLSKKVVNKIWRLFILRGWKVLIQFGVAVLGVFQDSIKKTPQDELFSFMRNILTNITLQTQKQLWPLMASIQVSNRMIDYLSREMNVLFEDSEIQLWRLEQELQEKEKLQKQRGRRYSLSGCRPSLSKIHLTMSQKRIPQMAKYIQQEKHGDGCCSPYYFSRQSIKTEADTSDEYSILSACRSVHYQ